MNVTAELARTTLAHAYNYACFRAQHAATIDAWTRSLQTSDPATRRMYTELYIDLAAGRDTLILDGCRRALGRLGRIELQSARGKRLFGFSFPTTPPAIVAINRLINTMNRIDPDA